MLICVVLPQDTSFIFRIQTRRLTLSCHIMTLFVLFPQFPGRSFSTRSMGWEALTFLSPATSPSSLRFSPSLINKDTSSLEAATLLLPRVQQSTMLPPPSAEPLHVQLKVVTCEYPVVSPGASGWKGEKTMKDLLKKDLRGWNVYVLIKYSWETTFFPPFHQLVFITKHHSGDSETVMTWLVNSFSKLHKQESRWRADM